MNTTARCVHCGYEYAQAQHNGSTHCAPPFAPVPHDFGHHARDLRQMDFKKFSAANRARCEHRDGFNMPLASWTMSDWMTAALGELGEAANVVKKLNRARDGIIGNSESPELLTVMLKDELADTFIYLDLMAQAAGFDLEDVVRDKFNRTSHKIGYVTDVKK
jgi:NTP pyrophosphatase (non-canonical NTP hydrolase)